MLSTETLAIWGAITGSVSAMATVWTWVRERPHLTLTTMVRHIGSSDNRHLRCTIVNQSRSPMTVMEAGVALDISPTGRWPRRRLRPVSMVHAPEDGQLPALLAPFQPFTWTAKLRPDDDQDRLPMQAYAIDARGREVWGFHQQRWMYRRRMRRALFGR